MQGPYTGDPNFAGSYKYGKHWRGTKGYKAVTGMGAYGHHFGGETWKLPICPNCAAAMHQIFTFDLTDPRLGELQTGELRQLPLVSCLNCSGAWEPQLFKLDPAEQAIRLLRQEDDQHWKTAEEDALPVPLPRSPVELIELDEFDIPVDEEHYEIAFERLGREYVCRVLGAPLYCNDPIDRECPCCRREMTYLGMLTEEGYGEEEKLIPGVDFHLGELILYFSLCRTCLVIKTEMQGT